MLQEIEPVKNRWDFLIVAALEEEIQAFESVFDQEKSHISRKRLRTSGESSCASVSSLSFTIGSGARRYSGLLASPQRVGTIAMTALVAYLLAYNTFSIVVLAGLAAAIKGKEKRVRLGDIVVADAVVDVQVGKHFDGAHINLEPGTDHLERRPVSVLISDAVVGKVQELGREPLSFGTRRAISQDGSAIRKRTVKYHIGTFLTSNRVVASQFETRRLAELASRYPPFRFPLAVEMEGIGVAGAIEQISRKTPFAIVKAINDYGDRHKAAAEARWRAVACHNSASASWAFVKHFLSES